jgi:hypothetical protein
VEKIVGRLSLEPTISAARWQAEVDLDPQGRGFPDLPAAGAGDEPTSA